MIIIIPERLKLYKLARSDWGLMAVDQMTDLMHGSAFADGLSGWRQPRCKLAELIQDACNGEEGISGMRIAMKMAINNRASYIQAKTTTASIERQEARSRYTSQTWPKRISWIRSKT